MNVPVIPEDFRKDRYILKPLFERLFRSIGKPHARIQVCYDPVLGGVGEALKPARVRGIAGQYEGMTNLFILCVDRNSNERRRHRLDRLEREIGDDTIFFAENAWEEIETWILAGLDLPDGWRWNDVRAEIQVKKRYFEPLARERGVADGPGGGRKALGEEASRRIDVIRRKCREDFDTLARRVEATAGRQ